MYPALPSNDLPDSWLFPRVDPAGGGSRLRIGGQARCRWLFGEIDVSHAGAKDCRV